MTPLVNKFRKSLRPCSGCGGIDLSDPTYDQFWKPNGDNDMQYVLQITVEAETVEEALSKKAEGKTISINPRPQPAPANVTPTMFAGLPHGAVVRTPAPTK